MTVLNAAFPAEFVEWFPGEDFADGGSVSQCTATAVKVTLVGGINGGGTFTLTPNGTGGFEFHDQWVITLINASGWTLDAGGPSGDHDMWTAADSTCPPQTLGAWTQTVSDQGSTLSLVSLVAGGGTPHSNGLQLAKLGARL